MAKKMGEYVWGVDYDSLRLDVNEWVKRNGVTLGFIDEALGKEIAYGLAGGAKSRYTLTKNMAMRNFMDLCDLCDLDPREYIGAFPIAEWYAELSDSS